jgi:hypothetical protein
VVVALALVASVVTGGERTAGPFPAAKAEPPQQNPGSGELDLEKLNRKPSESEVQDLFSLPATPVAAAAPQPKSVIKAPPAAPAAPPLPFKYLGHMDKRGVVTVFVESNQQELSLAPGDVVETVYKVESTSDSAVVFTYLPLGQKQTMPLPANL